MKRRKSTKAVSIAVTIAMMMSLGGYVFADEVEETEAPEETIAEEVPEEEAVEPLEENEDSEDAEEISDDEIEVVEEEYVDELAEEPDITDLSEDAETEEISETVYDVECLAVDGVDCRLPRCRRRALRERVVMRQLVRFRQRHAALHAIVELLIVRHLREVFQRLDGRVQRSDFFQLLVDLCLRLCLSRLFRCLLRLLHFRKGIDV